MELHHLLEPKDEPRFGFEPWVVPVHGPNSHQEVCHSKGLQAYAKDAGRRLLDALKPKDFDERCKKIFHRGYLPACVLLRRQAWLKSKELEEAQVNVLFTLNAAAGCGVGKRFVEELERHPNFADLQGDPDFELYTAAVYSNWGEPSRAVRVCKDLEYDLPRVRTTRDPTFAKLARVRATITPTHKNANLAIEVARDFPDPFYQVRTSTLTRGAAYEVQRNYGAASEVADDLGSEFDAGTPSWWHSIQHRSLFARSTILREGIRCSHITLRTALKELIRAQYACALLDLVGLPVPDFRTSGYELPLAVLTPTAIIQYLGETRSLCDEEMDEIRYEALFGQSFRRAKADTWPLGFQAKVLETLCLRDPEMVGGHPDGL